MIAIMKLNGKLAVLLFFFVAVAIFFLGCRTLDIKILKQDFHNPPATAQPGVYWYFMDGNLSKEGITEDLKSMKNAGISNVIYLEVNLKIPRGPVDFLSSQWQELFKHAVSECNRLGIRMTLGIGPGWAGSGGPWVSPGASMQHLVSSTIQVTGASKNNIILPLPPPKKPYFGEASFSPELKIQWNTFYEDVAVLAFPTPVGNKRIEEIDEKALYYRAPFTSAPGVKPFLPSLSEYVDSSAGGIQKSQIINLTDKLQPNGMLDWNVPSGNWTIMRFGRRNNGAVTRPAPVQGLGFESDKFDTVALNGHLDKYVGTILRNIGPVVPANFGGLHALHIDSWEMGSQNWTQQFRQEFTKRRGYDPLPFYPVYAGFIVGNVETSERFLWDLRQTSQELILEYHAGQVKIYAHKHGLELSIEPYDMNPTADLELGSVADIPMGEFWSKGFGFNSAFSCIEATSIAHVNGIPVVQAEAFTSSRDEAWKQYPGSLKNQGDWAFATGINRFFYHTFQHQSLNDSLRPGMTMGQYGVHWDRNQTWWPMVADYHSYISRCSYILQQGRSVADILYLTPEGAPHVFLPPLSAMTEDAVLPDRRGYNFDGCSPSQLFSATVKDHQIKFPGGATYHLLVMPAVETMTPALLEKIKTLINEGAVVIGNPPQKSPSLSGFPESDQKVQELSMDVWGSLEIPRSIIEHNYGQGKIISGGDLTNLKSGVLYPDYDLTANFLRKMGVEKDFESNAPIRYTHRTSKDWDIYFVSNRSDQRVEANCIFRSGKGQPGLWDPLTGRTRKLPNFSISDDRTTVPLQFDPYQSFFIVFATDSKSMSADGNNFPVIHKSDTLHGSWSVAFDPKWGGPEKVTFDTLTDWTTRPETGIRYYSGIAVYQKSFDIPMATNSNNRKRFYIDLGNVKNMARIELNGKDLGVVWTNPWKVDVTGILKSKNNQLKISVANLWPNRLIGDSQFPKDGIQNGRYPEWLLKGEKRTSGRYSFSTFNPYNKNSPLLESGLMGPVIIQIVE